MSLLIDQISLPDCPLILAPMEDVTDPPFRAICREMGADLVYSEFISSEGLIRNAKKSLIKLDVLPAERPVAIQVFGHDIQSMMKAVEMVSEVNPDIIDINFGCPVRKVVTKGAGAAALKNPAKMIEMTAAVVRSTQIPVTVKTRLGWDAKNIIIPELAEQLQDQGIKALAVHARTATQLYGGSADWSWFLKIKENQRFKIPLFGNGDVKTPADAYRMKTGFPVDGIMIGRASIGYPWIFRDIRQFFKDGNVPAPPDIEERIAVCKRHLLDSAAWKGEKCAIFEMRRQYSHYFKGLADFKSIRIRLVESTSLEEVLSILDTISTHS